MHLDHFVFPSPPPFSLSKGPSILQSFSRREFRHRVDGSEIHFVYFRWFAWGRGFEESPPAGSWSGGWSLVRACVWDEPLGLFVMVEEGVS